MDTGRILTALMSIVIFTMLITIIFNGVYGSMDVNGDPINWNQWNGYKAAAAFTAINDAEETGRTAEDYVQRKKKVLSTGSVPTPDRYVCSNELPGFMEENRVNIITYGSGSNCERTLSGLNLTVYSNESISSLGLDTRPPGLEYTPMEDVEQ